MKRALWFTFVLAVACTAASAQTGIKTVVKLLETRYSVHHHGVPALWLAKPFMLGSGVGGLKIAEFENFRVASDDAGKLQLEVNAALGPEWFPFVETWSKRDREWSVIYAKEAGEKMQLLIVTSEENDGLTVLQMNVSGKARQDWFHEPVDCAKRDHKNETVAKKGE
jgi:hypothetical protein